MAVGPQYRLYQYQATVEENTELCLYESKIMIQNEPSMEIIRAPVLKLAMTWGSCL